GADTSAQKFAGQVFPAMEAEQLGSTRLKYENDIKALRDQINQIGATKSKLAAAALPGLLNSARSYNLQKASQKQTAIKQARDFKIEKGNLALGRVEKTRHHHVTHV